MNFGNFDWNVDANDLAVNAVIVWFGYFDFQFNGNCFVRYSKNKSVLSKFSKVKSKIGQ